MKRLIYIFVLLFHFSCQKEPIQSIAPHNTEQPIFICNEGNFTFGNASLSVYNLESRLVENDVFFRKNLFPLGDILNDIVIGEDSTAYLVINNSGKIIAMNKYTFEFQYTITGFNSPRSLIILSKNRGLVTELFSKYIHIVDLKRGEIIQSILFRENSEYILAHEDFLYINTWSFGEYIYKLRMDDYIVIDSIRVAYQPESMAIDSSDNLWVISDGGNPSTPRQEIPAITKIDLQSFQIDQIFSFTSKIESALSLTLNPTGDSLYYIHTDVAGNNGLYRMHTQATSLPSTPFINFEKAKVNYVKHIDNHLYISNPKDYIAPGEVYVSTIGGQIVDTLEVGIIPRVIKGE